MYFITVYVVPGGAASAAVVDPGKAIQPKSATTKNWLFSRVKSVEREVCMHYSY